MCNSALRWNMCTNWNNLVGFIRKNSSLIYRGINIFYRQLYLQYSLKRVSTMFNNMSVKTGIKAIFLIVIMITMSIGQSISNDRNFEENDRGEISKIDISYLDYLNEESNLDYALSQT